MRPEEVGSRAASQRASELTRAIEVWCLSQTKAAGPVPGRRGARAGMVPGVRSQRRSTDWYVGVSGLVLAVVESIRVMTEPPGREQDVGVCSVGLDCSREG